MALVCAVCGAEQAPGGRFCSNCGEALYRNCPVCQTEQLSSAAFCSACGAALHDPARRTAGITEGQERRLVTVLFADLAGSTALGDRLDPEDVRELQAALFSLLHAEVERFGGTTEKFAGDAIMAVFGIPHAHEDDAERAVRAALAAQERFGDFAARVRADYDAVVGLRIGVNTGEVVTARDAATRGELMVSGDAVNVAARLEQAAEPGAVLVGERTHVATNRAIAYDEPAAVEAKGKSGKVRAWAAHAAVAAPAERRGGLVGPMIGRDHEMAILEATAARVDRDRVAQIVTMFGPAGVGKSRLLEELVGRLPAARVLQGRCLPYGESITYWPLGEAAKADADILATDSAETAQEKLRAAVAAAVDDAVRDSVFEAMAWTIGAAVPEAAIGTADPGYVRRLLGEAWQRYLTGLGRQQFTVLVVEDIHWASAVLLDLVEHLAETLVDTRVLLLCTARPELLETRPMWGAAKQNATSLSLTSLTQDDSARLVSSLLGQAQLPVDLRDRILASGEGNPFFLEEMVQMLIEDHVLEQRDGDWVATQQPSEVPIPDSVHGVIAARIDLLDPTTRQALRHCSVVGRIFWPAAVGVDDKPITTLTYNGLVSLNEPSVMAGLGQYAFKHALTRDVAYGSLPRAERRALHRRVAEWIQGVAPDRDAEMIELVAYHYRQAVAYGEDDVAVLERACDQLVAAGHAALRKGAYVASRMHLEQAVELASDDERRAHALLALADLDASEARLDDAVARLDLVRDLVGRHPAARAAALALLSRVSWVSGRWDEATETANEAVDALAGEPESRQLASALARRSQLEMLRNRPAAAAHALEAIAVAERVGDQFAGVNARINLFTVQANAGVAPDPAELLDIVDAASSIGAYEEAYRATVNYVWSTSGYYPVDHVEEVTSAVEAKGLPPLPFLSSYLQASKGALLLVPAGRWPEADAILAASNPSSMPSIGTLPLLWRPTVGGLAVRRGDLTAAADVLEDLPPLALASGEPQRILPMAGAVLPWLLVSGRHQDLRDLAAEVLVTVGSAWMAVVSVDPIVRTLALAGEWELLSSFVASVRRVPYAQTGRLAISLAIADGLTALEAGRAEDSGNHLTAAIARADELGVTYDSACMQLDLAKAQTRAGKTDEAERTRRRAEAYLATLGCVHPV